MTPPEVSAKFVKIFRKYNRGYLRRNFHSLRILKTGIPVGVEDRPLVIFLNHASWWDPLVCFRMAENYFPNRNSYGPINAEALERYGFFKKIGFYGVQQDSAKGARNFLDLSKTILRNPKNIIWLTPQGEFTDARERPPKFRRGLGMLALNVEANFLAMAVEYSFWTEKKAEVLVSFGKLISSAHSDSREMTETFQDALADAQEDLALASCRRELSEWETLDRGVAGVNAIYDGWRWLKAKIAGKNFEAEHRPENSK